ncbi:MAG: ribonuclease H-like domain-containing protein [Lachnospiraceae bacterium]|nr:ribonuclease H-like domain-containing protein [Lachnospiraceae bacterium]
MKIIKSELSNIKLNYPLDETMELEKTLFIDIETTGFTAKGSSLYLIGCIYQKNNSFHLIQWFADHYDDEVQVLREFFRFVQDYSYLVHFNGNNFDIPYLQQKAIQYGLPDTFDHFEALDLYRRIAPFKEFLKLPNCKQKTIEIFLNVNREDTFHGGELISVYHEYVKAPSESNLQILLLHNADDIQGLVSLLPVLSYCDLFLNTVRVTKVQANYYTDYVGDKKQEVLMKLRFKNPLPVAVSQGVNNCYFTGFDMEGTLKVPIFQGELKYFYANYRDYYYLPLEDCSIHKSVAHFVDHDHRIKATASNCYTKKTSSYLPQWDVLFQPFFKEDYRSKELYFELTDEFKKQRDDFSRYANHVLQMLFENL